MKFLVPVQFLVSLVALTLTWRPVHASQVGNPHDAPMSPQVKACVAMLQLDEVVLSPKLSAFAVNHPAAVKFLKEGFKAENANSKLSQAVVKAEEALTREGYQLNQMTLDLTGSRNGFAGETEYVTFIRTYTNRKRALAVDLKGAANFVLLSKDRSSGLTLTKLEQGEPSKLEIEPAQISKRAKPSAIGQKTPLASERLASLQKIVDEAPVGNGESGLTAYEPTHFNLEQAKKEIAAYRPDITSNDKDETQIYFKTEVGVNAGIRLLESADLKIEDDPTPARIKTLRRQGLIREIVFRSISKVDGETYMVPYVFDIYVEYPDADGVLKGQRVRLYYELGD